MIFNRTMIIICSLLAVLFFSFGCADDPNKNTQQGIVPHDFLVPYHGDEPVMSVSTETPPLPLMSITTDTIGPPEDLGTLGGSSSTAHGVNNLGQVIGYSTTTVRRQRRAFFWTEADGMIDLGTLGGTNTMAYGINDDGQVVGYSTNALYVNNAFIWTKAGGMTGLGSPDEWSYAKAINKSGQIVGTVQNAAFRSRAFLWTEDEGMIHLGTLGGLDSHAESINDAGEIVGYSTNATGRIHAFLWTETDGMIDLGALGGDESLALGINNSSQIVGNSRTSSVQIHAFFWTRTGGMIDLGTLGPTSSNALGIDDKGQVVGHSASSTGLTHAFIWTEKDGMTDLGPGAFYSISGRGNYVAGTFSFDVAYRAARWELPTVIPVEIDVKPGSDENPVNLKASNGVIPVAILSTDDFDATTVDVFSVAFGPGGALEAHGKGHIEDVDHDGDLDMMLHFRVGEVGLDPQATTVTLFGQTVDGEDIEGSDNITIKGGNKGKGKK